MFNPGTIFVGVILYVVFIFFKAGHPHLENIPHPVVIAMCLFGASMLLHGSRRQSISNNSELKESSVSDDKTDVQKKDIIETAELKKDQLEK